MGAAQEARRNLKGSALAFQGALQGVASAVELVPAIASERWPAPFACDRGKGRPLAERVTR